MDTKKCRRELCNNLLTRRLWKGYPESKSNWAKRKYCSKRCEGLTRGIMLTSEQEAKRIANLPRGKNHGLWKGDKVGIDALHQWLHKQLPKPEFCTKCNTRKAYDLANKGIYNRDLKNWEWLCRKCHMESDGRMNNLHKGIISPKVKRGENGRFYV